jgi:hypothetical protein
VRLGQIRGTGDGIGRRLGQHTRFRDLSDRGRRWGGGAMADDAKGAVPRVFVQVEGEHRPTHKEEQGQQAGDAAKCTRGAEHLD